jgi:hypothetical protein
VSYISHQKAWSILDAMKPGASTSYRGVGIERHANGWEWSIQGGHWLLLLPAIDEFARAAGFSAYQEHWSQGVGKWSR